MTPDTARHLEPNDDQTPDPSSKQSLSVVEEVPDQKEQSFQNWQESGSNFNSPIFPTRVRDFEDMDRMMTTLNTTINATRSDIGGNLKG